MRVFICFLVILVLKISYTYFSKVAEGFLKKLERIWLFINVIILLKVLYVRALRHIRTGRYLISIIELRNSRYSDAPHALIESQSIDGSRSATK